MLKIFVSYTRADEKTAEWLVRALQDRGFNVWYGKEIPGGTSIPQETFSRFLAADCMVLLWSPDAQKSWWVQDELSWAVHRRNGEHDFTIIPVLLEPCPLPMIHHIAAVEMTTGDRHAVVAELVRALERVPERSGAAATPPVADIGAAASAWSPAQPGERAGPGDAVAAGEGAARRSPPYRNQFRMASLQLPYIPLVSNWEKGFSGYRYGEVDVEADLTPYELPAAFRNNPAHPHGDEAKCRLVNYRYRFGGAEYPPRLELTFAKAWYSDYLRTGEYLDHPLPDDPARTFRDVYARELGRGHIKSSRLPNVSGVGVFIITRDRKVLLTRRSNDVLVYPDVVSYSASGTMDWGERPNPFHDIVRECAEEIGHRVSFEDDLRLFAVGIDAVKAYYQFSFVERTGRSSEEISAEAANAPRYDMKVVDLIALPFEVEAVAESIGAGDWEPAAAATLLTLCANEYGRAAVERAIDDEFVTQRWRAYMLAEWRQRASRPGDQAVMSARYPLYGCEQESKRYTEAVLRFLDGDVDDRDVLEIGCGNGRLTEALVKRARRLTSLDLSEEMIRLNRERLGPRAALVEYACGFAQDYRPKASHDVVISSLVLIHNVEDRPFYDLVNAMRGWADTLFLFEDVGITRRTSSTRLRNEQELLAAFHDYTLERRQEYDVYEDQILFLKLVRAPR